MASVHVPWRQRTTPEMRTQHAKLMKDYRAKKHDAYLERERRSKAKVPLYLRQQRALKYNLFHQYGITPEHYYWMLFTQNGCCAICNGNNDDDFDKRLHVDHDHATRRVRGLLCRTCNQGMIAVDACHDFCDQAKHYRGGGPSRSQG